MRAIWKANLLRRAIQLAALGGFLWLLIAAAWPYQKADGSIGLQEKFPLETFLWIDPLVGISAAIAGRAWTISLVGAGAIIVLGILIPRSFCGYLCPMGTLIDIVDAIVRFPLVFFRTKRQKRLHRLAHLRYYILAFVLIAAVFGVMLAGFVSPIPVLTRGLMFTVSRWELGLRRNWSMVGPMTPWMYVSLALFAAIPLLGILAPRFWCRYLCPSGAIFSLANLLRLTERRITGKCSHCDKCRRACPFDAIEKNHTTRGMDCAMCQTCGTVCPQDAIRYARRASSPVPRPETRIPTGEACPAPVDRPPISRRVVLASAIGAGAIALWPGSQQSHGKPLRPPGSVGEERFLALCVRCDECLKVCPGAMLQPAGLGAGFAALWTPVAMPLHAGCHQDCNFCTLVCPTGAIRPLSLEEKRRTVMGIAEIDTAICLGHRADAECDPELSLRMGRAYTPCMQECDAAGYRAIHMKQVKVDLGDIPEGAASEDEIEAMSRRFIPQVDLDKCVGCGLCEYRCHATVARQRHQIEKRAISVRAV